MIVFSYQTGNINSLFGDLSPSSHCKKLIDRVKLGFGVSLRDNLMNGSGDGSWVMTTQSMSSMMTYTEQLDMI